jgi:hypothetical protein
LTESVFAGGLGKNTDGEIYLGGWSTDQLEELLNRVQARYDELEEMGNKQMNTYCEERTGITLIPNKDR